MLVVKEQQQNVTQVLHNHGVKFAIVLSTNMAAVKSGESHQSLGSILDNNVDENKKARNLHI